VGVIETRQGTVIEILEVGKDISSNESFTSYKGKNLNTAILFPMEVLFESYND
jgi:5-methylcytosine-specific restriction endonuclease McrBC regulatory subunit McrC